MIKTIVSVTFLKFNSMFGSKCYLGTFYRSRGMSPSLLQKKPSELLHDQESKRKQVENNYDNIYLTNCHLYPLQVQM